MNPALQALIARYSGLYHQDLSRFFLYLSYEEPIRDKANLYNAVYMQADEQQAGFCTCVAVPYQLEQDTIDRLGLIPVEE